MSFFFFLYIGGDAVKKKTRNISTEIEEPIVVTPQSESILSSVKKLIGIIDEDESFDLDIMLNINAAFSTLFQLGVLSKPYIITSKENTYSEIIPDGLEDVTSQIKMYLVYKTRLGFDSSTLSSSVMESLKEMINEAEYRLMISFNPTDTFDRTGGEIQNE